MKKQQGGLQKRKALVGYAFIAPWLIGFGIFCLFPVVYSLMFSFSEIQDPTTFSFKMVGLQNYMDAFLVDTEFLPNFLQSVGDTLINMVLILFFSFFIAIIINRKIRFRSFFRVVFFLPVILGTGFILDQILGENLQEQSINVVRDLLFSEEVVRAVPAEFLEMVQELLNRITVVLWNSGVQILLFLTGLQGISSSIYEAARVDAAGEWEQFWLITLPLMSPMILLTIVYTLVAGFTNSSNVVLEYILEIAFEKNQLELSSAMGWIYFLFIILFVSLTFLFMRKPIDRASNR
ncbi:MAG: sugar ABC transporter permease [Clostridia bacterium]|nr:sugar ABC transporter permease [Clostridia bacterium]